MNVKEKIIKRKIKSFAVVKEIVNDRCNKLNDETRKLTSIEWGLTCIDEAERNKKKIKKLLEDIDIRIIRLKQFCVGKYHDNFDVIEYKKQKEENETT